MENTGSRRFRDHVMTVLVMTAVLVVIASVYVHAIQALLPIAALLLALYIYLSKDGNVRWISGALAFGFGMSTLSNICWYLIPSLGFDDLVSWYYYYYVTGVFWLIGYIVITYVMMKMISSRQWYLEHRIDRMITAVTVVALFLTGLYVFLNLDWSSDYLIDIFVLLTYLCIDILIGSMALKMALAVRGELRYLAISIMTFFAINMVADLLFETRWLFRLSNLITVNLDRVVLSFHIRDLIDITYNISIMIVTGLLFLFVLDPFARRTLEEVRGRLKDTQLFVDDLIAKSPDATCIFDRNGQLVLVNDRFLQVFGLKRSDLDRSFNIFGQKGTQLFHDEMFGEILKVRDRETVIIPKLKITGLMGKRTEDFYVYLKMFPTYGSDGRVLYYVMIIEEITERVRLEDDLFKAYNSLKEEYERKIDFTNAAAHELRTPLTPIIGYTDILKAEVEDERHREFLEIIERNAQRQKALVNRMLELASLDAGMAHVNSSEFAVQPLVVEIAENYRAVNPNIRIEAPGGMLINTDIDILRHVLDNLVSNAVKYSDHDREIEIRVTEAGDSYQFSVKDQGAGIPAEEWGRIFERFYIVGGESDSRASGRSGLGLALVKAYISLIGGHVWLESEAGKGSTFFFTVPKKSSSDGKSH
jgi:PAS domain S-box-containing protein